MIKNPCKGKFIAFEGPDGSGSSTQMELLKKYLLSLHNEQSQKYPPVHATKEPTSNSFGGLIREALQHRVQLSPRTLQRLFTTDRSHHLETEIIPLLQKGITVLTDRYAFSTIAYGAVDINDWKWLLHLNSDFIFPDLTFILLVDPKECMARIQKSRFHQELFETEESLRKVVENYRRVVREFSSHDVFALNGEQPQERIFATVKTIVNKKFGIKRQL